MLLASPTEVARHILAREKSELEERYREEKGQPEACFIEEALKSLAEREQGRYSVLLGHLSSRGKY